MSICNGSHWCSQTVVNVQSMSVELQFPKETHNLLVHSHPGTLCLLSVALISLRLLLWKASSGMGFHRCLWSSFSFHENKVIFHPSIFSRWFQTGTGTSMPVIFSKGDAQGQWPPEESLTCWPAFLLPSLACILPANLASQPNWEELLWRKTAGLLVPEAGAYPSKAGDPWGEWRSP